MATDDIGASISEEFILQINQVLQCVPGGEYDEDGDGELKTGFFWRPKEGFAFSNNYTPKGPPKFKKASIELIHGEPVTIELNY